MRTRSTPWGPSQSANQKADGIVFHSTAGHGGYHLSPEREAARQKRFPLFTTYAGGPWYEEDQDWAVVALTFPEHYDAAALRGAVNTARISVRPFQGEVDARWQSIVDWLDGNSLTAQDILSQVSYFEIERAAQWEQGSMSSHAAGYPDRCWSVHFTRVGDGAEKWVVLKGYPEQHFYTDEELAAVTAEPLPVKPKPEPKIGPFPAHCARGNSFDFEPSDADPGL